MRTPFHRSTHLARAKFYSAAAFLTAEREGYIKHFLTAEREGYIKHFLTAEREGYIKQPSATLRVT